VAPATFSCIISIILWYCLLPYSVFYILTTALLFVLGVYVAHDLAKEWGKDPRRIVIDEYATLLIPLYFTPPRILPLVVTFLLFRFFDIVKPPPIRNLENIKGGWGIMLDDLGAAVFTAIIIVILRSVAFV
jgi:phosphatidylglycerophosphatase A